VVKLLWFSDSQKKRICWKINFMSKNRFWWIWIGLQIWLLTNCASLTWCHRFMSTFISVGFTCPRLLFSTFASKVTVFSIAYVTYDMFLQSGSREMEFQMNEITMNSCEFFIWNSISRDSDCITGRTSPVLESNLFIVDFIQVACAEILHQFE